MTTILRAWLAALLLCGGLTPSAWAAERIFWDPATLQQILQEDIRALEALAAEPPLIRALQDSNQQVRTLDDIGELDRLWGRSENSHPFKVAMLSSEASLLLKQYMARNPMYAELILANGQGENVALYPAATDYWQADEAPWQYSYIKGGVYIGPPVPDASTAANVVKISVPVRAGDDVVGVLIGAIRLSYIFHRQTSRQGLPGAVLWSAALP
jgi:hypothetical protein